MLVVDKVSKSYGRNNARVRVIHDVSLVVARGETVWLRGPSGSGKSSLLRIAGLLSTPDSGRILLDDREMTPGSRSSDAVRRRSIGIVFQQSNLLPDLTVAQNVLLATPNTSRASVLEQLDAFGLVHVADRPAKTISGGEAQRVAFCRALVKDPALLLADEPTSGLDEANAEPVLEQIVASGAAGRAILVASHDPSMARVADRTLVMEAGSLV